MRTLTRGSHRVRIAFPSGARQTGSGRLISVLHPRGENPNPCGVRYLINPAEILIMGANPHRPRHPNPHKLGREISRMKNRGASSREVGRFLSRATNPKYSHRSVGPVECRRLTGPNPHRRGRRGNPSVIDPILRRAVQAAIKKSTSFHDFWFYRMTPEQRGFWSKFDHFERDAQELYRHSIGGGIPRGNPRWVRTPHGTVGRVLEVQGRPQHRVHRIYISGMGPQWVHGRVYDVDPRQHGISESEIQRIEAVRNPRRGRLEKYGELFTGEAQLVERERQIRRAARTVPASDPDRQRAVALYRQLEGGDEAARLQIANINSRRGWTMALVALWARGGGRNPQTVRAGKVTYEVIRRQDLTQMRAEGLPRLADHIEKRGFVAQLYVKRPRGAHHLLYETRAGRYVLVNPSSKDAIDPSKCRKCGKSTVTGGYTYGYCDACLKKMAKRGQNPSGTEEAAELYEQFHGREPAEILELQEPEARGVTLTSLGDLIELQIVPVEGRKWVQLEFSGDRIKLASNTKGSQLYFIGGNQNLTGDVLATFGTDTSKELVELGQAAAVVYRAKKSITDFKSTNWEHSFGEESGMRPIVAYDTRTKRLLLVGGEYTIEAPGIIN